MLNYILAAAILVLVVIIDIMTKGQNKNRSTKKAQSVNKEKEGNEKLSDEKQRLMGVHTKLGGKIQEIKIKEQTKDKLLEKDRNNLDYNTYQMTYSEKIKYLIITCLLIFSVGYVFYRNLIICLLLCPLSFLFLKYIKISLRDKRKKELANQFNEGLYAIATALGAGKSIEQAFRESLKDLSQETYPLIHHEFSLIVHKVEINENIETAVMDFAKRSHVDDIQNFADILVTSKRTEGDIISIIKRTTRMISEKMEIKREIETNIAQKKFEQKILTAMPIFIILFLSTTSKGYLDPLYTTFIGRVVMTVALAAIIVCYILSSKIIDIEV